MGEANSTLFGFSFNRSIELEGRPERLTADAGVLAVRELDERVGLMGHSSRRDYVTLLLAALREVLSTS